jgi:hypothetical protein
MGLRDDIAAMERHDRNGTLRQWFEGTAPALSASAPLDPSAQPIASEYRWMRERGD